MATTILTEIGARKLSSASGTDNLVAISHVALGDGQGGFYSPLATQTGLQRELTRRAIDRRQFLGDNSWRVLCEFPTTTPEMTVREIGFFDQDGDLIALQARTASDAPQTGRIAYRVEQFLRIDANGQVMTVAAPDDELFDFAVATTTRLANLETEILQIRAEIRALRENQ